MNSKQYIEVTDKYSAHNYHPLDIVISKASGVWFWDVEGNKYMDMLSAYSAVNQGHLNPRVLETLIKQAKTLTLTSRAFHNDQFGPFAKKLCEACDMEMMLPMNTGAEAVETAIKTARKWGYQVKGVEKDKAKIIVCENNFHGRTTTIISFSTEEQYKDGFGPLTPGFEVIPYGDSKALENAIDKNTVAFLVEPIQGEAGVVVPPASYLKVTYDICKKNNVLFMADEIQTGLGRTGKMFCCQHDNIKPDVLIVGKALGGGVYPVSAVLSSRIILSVFKPGDHGSTFGGNPLACAVASTALDVLIDEKLPEKAYELGNYFMNALKSFNMPAAKEIRGKGLLIGLEIKKGGKAARQYCEALKKEGLLCKETHATIIRFAPPLVITKEEIDWAIERIKKVFCQ